MPNYKHSEPYCLLKNMKDFANEDHHFPTRYTKHFLKGGLLGAIYGMFYAAGGPQGPFEMNKLAAAGGSRPFSGIMARLAVAICTRHACIGGAMMVSYFGIQELLRHHKESVPRSRFMDHTIAFTLISTGVGAYNCATPWGVFCWGFMGLTVGAPLTWYLKVRTGANSMRASNIFYENSCSAEEVERFRHQDEIENLGMQFSKQPGYGYHML